MGAGDRDDPFGLRGAGDHAGQDDAVVDSLGVDLGPWSDAAERVLQGGGAGIHADAQGQDLAAGGVEEDRVGLAGRDADDEPAGRMSA